MTRGRDRAGAGLWPWVAAGVVLSAAFVRLTTITSTGLPYWFTDPWIARSPESTLTPMGSLLLDALVWLGALIAVAAERRSGRRVRWWVPGAILAGAIVVGLHGFVLHSPLATGPDGTAGARGLFGSFVLGSAWVGAMLGAWTLSLVSRHDGIKRAVLSIAMGAGALLLIKALLNVTVEHSAGMAEFNKDPSGYLQRQGMEPGSRAAAVYERRLRRPEATGWIGLSNALGTVAGALTLGLAAVLLDAWRRGVTRPAMARLAAAALVMVAAMITLALTRSKGAIASAAGAGAILGVISMLRGRLPARWLIAGAVAATLAPLVAVATRGMVGDSLNERSLLFRWQYLVGAVRVIADHPVVGVGPDGIKAAYLLARLPEAPEEVSSAHSVLFDWAATLGVVGIAWGAVWIGWLARGASNLMAPMREPREPDPLEDLRADTLTLGVCGVAAGVSLWSEWASLAEPVAGAYLVGFLLWIVAARVIRRTLIGAPMRATHLAAFGAALVVGVHAHIEVTGTLDGSAALALGLLGLAATARDPGTGRMRGDAPLFALLGAGVLAIGAFALGPVRAWQADAGRAADELAPGRPAGDQRVALAWLDKAGREMPSDAGAGVATVRLRIAESFDQRADAASVLAGQDGALGRAERLTERWPGWTQAWALRARCEEFAGERLSRPDLSIAAESSWEMVCRLDPQGVGPAYERWRLLSTLGRVAEARELGVNLLERDDRFRKMDPLAGLSEGMRREIEAWLSGDGAPERADGAP